jgi:hypothetical protein
MAEYAMEQEQQQQAQWEGQGSHVQQRPIHIAAMPLPTLIAAAAAAV